MDTNKLIDKLGDNLTPVTPVRPPVLSALAFVFGMTGLILGGAYLASGTRPDMAAKITDPAFLREAALLMSGALLSGLAAFRLSIPDTRIRRPVIAAMLAGSALWLVACAFHCQHALEGIHPHEIMAGGLHCVRDLAIILLLPLVTGMVMATRASPVWSGYAAYCMTICVSSIATVTLRLICANDASEHLLIWHFLPALVFSGVGVVLGRFLSRFLTQPEKI